MNLTCNSTLDDLRILPTSEIKIAGPFTFHTLAEVISAACTAIAIAMSTYLIFQHARHYTKPVEQKHIIRILFMVPVYAASSLLSLHYYWNAIYFQVISDCYEAFAISSFFALLCAYIDVDLHEQKEFFRQMRPIKDWVMPVNYFKKCCGGERGPWRTPVSGLTWFNIIWIGIYHYCFIRVTMTVTAVVTQYYGRYCESSNNPVFAHVWILVINSVAVSIAMYCVIQFYIQLRTALADHSPFLKVLAIKLVIFLSFWQSTIISLGTSYNIVKASDIIAYPDIKVGITAMLLCVEMAAFSILHLWAFPYRPYIDSAPATFYPVPDPDASYAIPKQNLHQPRSGGFMGLRAIGEAINIWDVAKAFGRGIRWLFVGVRHRRDDVSYQMPYKTPEMDMDELSADHFNGAKQGAGHVAAGGVMAGGIDTAYHPGLAAMKSTEHLPIATSFRHSRLNTLQGGSGSSSGSSGVLREGGASGPNGAPVGNRRQLSDEAAGLIAYAQPMSAQGLEGSPERYGEARQGGMREAVYRDVVYEEEYGQSGYSQEGYAPSGYNRGGYGRGGYHQGGFAPGGNSRGGYSQGQGPPASGRRGSQARGGQADDSPPPGIRWGEAR